MATSFNSLVEAGRIEAEGHYAALAVEYEKLIRRLGREAAQAFIRHQWKTPVPIAAAAGEPPKWRMPHADEVMNPAREAIRMREQTGRFRAVITQAAMSGVMAEYGIAFDLSNPLVKGVLTQLGTKITHITESIRNDIMAAIQDAYDQGLSIRDTGKQIRSSVNGIAKQRSEMIARTELTTAVNGGSHAAAKLVNEASPADTQMRKIWIATYDERTREAHAEAGATYGTGSGIPLDQPFLVDNEPLMYPGDDGSPENVINCRCAVGYEQAPQAADLVDSTGQVPAEMGPEEAAPLLGRAFANAPELESNVVAYRGLTYRLPEGMGPGGIVRDEGQNTFMSTTTNRAIAEQYAGGYDALAVTIPKGERTLWMPKMAAGRNAAVERELLLAPTKDRFMVITRVEDLPEGGKLYHVELRASVGTPLKGATVEGGRAEGMLDKQFEGYGTQAERDAATMYSGIDGHEQVNKLVAAKPEILNVRGVGQPLNAPLTGYLSNATASEDLRALWLPDPADAVATNLDLDTVTQSMIDAGRKQIYEATQRSLLHRGLPDQVRVYRSGLLRGNEPESFSLRPISGFGNQTEYTVARSDILVDSNAFFPGSYVGEDEVLIRADKVVEATPVDSMSDAQVDAELGRLASEPAPAGYEALGPDAYDSLADEARRLGDNDLLAALRGEGAGIQPQHAERMDYFVNRGPNGELRAVVSLAEHTSAKQTYRIAGVWGPTMIDREAALLGAVRAAAADGKILVYAGKDEQLIRFLEDRGFKVQVQGGGGVRHMVLGKRAQVGFLRDAGVEPPKVAKPPTPPEPPTRTPAPPATPSRKVIYKNDTYTIRELNHIDDGFSFSTAYDVPEGAKGGTVYTFSAEDGHQFDVFVEDGYRDWERELAHVADTIRSYPVERRKLQTIGFFNGRNPGDYAAGVRYGYKDPSKFVSAATARGGRMISFWGGRVSSGDFEHEMGHIIGREGLLDLVTSFDAPEAGAIIDALGDNLDRWERFTGGPAGPKRWVKAARADMVNAEANVGPEASPNALSTIEGHRLTLGRMGVTEYGNVAIQEDWAESVRLYMLQRSRGYIAYRYAPGVGQVRYTFEQLFPARAKILDQLFGGPIVASGVGGEGAMHLSAIGGVLDDLDGVTVVGLDDVGVGTPVRGGLAVVESADLHGADHIRPAMGRHDDHRAVLVYPPGLTRDHDGYTVHGVTKRDPIFPLRLNAEHRGRFEAAAKQRGVSLSEYLREAGDTLADLITEADPHTVTGKAGLPLGARDETWSAADAERAMDGATQLSTYHFYRDPEGDPEAKSSYKLAFGTPDPNPHAVWAGVTAVAAVLQGGRGGVDIPQADQDQVRTRVGAYYAAARAKYDDPSITPPWKDGGAECIDNQAALAALEEAPMAEEYTETTAPLSVTDAPEVATGDTTTERFAPEQSADESHTYQPIDPADSPDGACAICGSPMDDPIHVRQAAGIDADGFRVLWPFVTVEEGTGEPGDSPEPPPAPTGDGVPFRALLAVEGTPTDDGRMIEKGALSWREPPLTLMSIIEDSHGGMPQTRTAVAGRIDAIERVDTGEDTADIIGTGMFDTGEVGAEIARLVSEKMMRGVSIDLAVKTAREVTGEDTGEDGVDDPMVGSYLLVVEEGVIMGATVCPFAAFSEADIETVLAAGYHMDTLPSWAMPYTESRGENDVVVRIAFLGLFQPDDTPPPAPVDDPDNDGDNDADPIAGAPVNLSVLVDELPTADELAGADPAQVSVTYRGADLTITGIQLIDPSGETIDLPTEAPITASGAGMAPERPPAEWFDYPDGVDTLTPMTVTAEGRVYGHIAAFNECHIGSPPGSCITAPHHFRVDPNSAGAGTCLVCGERERDPNHSASGYDFFHLGELETAEGDLVRVGQVTLGTSHAPTTSITAKMAQEHYDNTGVAIADGVIYEDTIGPFFAGAIRPDVAANRVREFRAAKPSGDWRGIKGRRELIGVLMVNKPGFVVPRRSSQIEDGERKELALVAAGFPNAAAYGTEPCSEETTTEIRRLIASVGGDPVSDLVASARIDQLIHDARE